MKKCSISLILAYILLLSQFVASATNFSQVIVQTMRVKTLNDETFEYEQYIVKKVEKANHHQLPEKYKFDYVLYSLEGDFLDYFTECVFVEGSEPPYFTGHKLEGFSEANYTIIQCWNGDIILPLQHNEAQQPDS